MGGEWGASRGLGGRSHSSRRCGAGSGRAPRGLGEPVAATAPRAAFALGQLGPREPMRLGPGRWREERCHSPSPGRPGSCLACVRVSTRPGGGLTPCGHRLLPSAPRASVCGARGPARGPRGLEAAPGRRPAPSAVQSSRPGRRRSCGVWKPDLGSSGRGVDRGDAGDLGARPEGLPVGLEPSLRAGGLRAARSEWK